MFSCIGGKSVLPIPGERRYLWDKQTGNCRFEAITSANDTLVVLFNVKTSTGTVYVNNNQEKDLSSAKALVSKATLAFEQDANLLFLPTSLDGSDVNFTVEEEKLIGSKRFTVVNLQNHKTSFESSINGLLYVNEQTGHIQYWTSNQPNQPDYTIGGFKDIGGGLVLPTHFTGEDSMSTVTYPLAAALINIEAHKFNTP